MGKEIERKFLVNRQDWENLEKPTGKLYRQGYILTNPNKTVRVRIVEDKGYLTIKGRAIGVTRAEFEYEIPFADANELLDQFTEFVLSKIRYIIPFQGKIWEIDVFEGENAGLIVGEIELKSEEESFEIPHWIDVEVSHDKRYFNSNLVSFPFKSWKN